MPKRSSAEILKEITALRARLLEVEPTLQAIRNGEVDAFVIRGSRSEQVVLLEGAASFYRLLMEEIEQGALTLTPTAQILYCNRRLADMLRTLPERLTGKPFASIVLPAHQPHLKVMLAQAMFGPARAELTLQAANGTHAPVRLTCHVLAGEDSPSLAVLVTDLREHQRMDRLSRLQAVTAVPSKALTPLKSSR